MNTDQPDRSPGAQDLSRPRSHGAPGPTASVEERLRDLQAAIFDLDGVVTRTDRLHAAAWRQVFDDYLASRADLSDDSRRPFDPELDYRPYVDGKPRYEGVRSFLESRGIALPFGAPADPPERETVCGIGNRKNEVLQARLAQGEIEVFEGAVAFIRALRQRGVQTAVASSSRNATAVVSAAGLADLFDTQIDGVEAARLGLRGKPDPDVFLRAAEVLGAPPARCLVVEDALAGVEAARAGGFGLVIGVDRIGGREAELMEHGADIVVGDLAGLVPGVSPGPQPSGLPSALDRFTEIEARLRGRRPAVFLDYDGTLTPIVARPDLAVLTEETRAAVRDLAALCPVAVVSGRDRADVARLVGIEDLVFAGSHGFDIAGPGLRREYEAAAQFLPALDAAEALLRQELSGTAGALVERKRFAIAVHYRLVAEAEVGTVDAAVGRALAGAPDLRRTGGKKVFELRPNLPWDKGKAVLWLLEALGLDGPEVVPLYLGDDETDEDAFAALVGRGIGILVTEEPRPTAAEFALESPDEVRRLLLALAAAFRKGAAA